MRTFDACLSSVALWMAVLAPPVLFFLLAQVVDNAMERGEVGVGGWMLLTALAQLLPLGALLWMLFSPAAYSIAPGKLIVHRVTSEREILLETVADEPRLSKGVITLSVPKRGKIHVRVQQPEICLHELRHAVGSNEG